LFNLSKCSDSRFLYTGESFKALQFWGMVAESTEGECEVEQILAAADRFQVPVFAESCVDHLIATVTLENVLDGIKLADDCRNVALMVRGMLHSL